MRTSHCPIVGKRPEGMTDSQVYEEIQEWLGLLYSIKMEVAEELEAKLQNVVNLTAHAVRRNSTQEHIWTGGHSAARLGVDQLCNSLDAIIHGTRVMMHTMRVEDQRKDGAA